MGKELSGKWEMVKLGDVCSLITDGTHQTPTYSEDGYIFLSSKNVTSGSIDWNNVKYVGEELHQKLYKRLSPQYNDILLAKNGTTGVCAKVDKKIIFDIYVSLALLRPKKIIDADYLVFVINNPYTKRKFDSHLKGIGVPNLHLSSIKDTKIPLPPLEIQKEIARNLDLASELVKLHKRKLEELDKLIQSVFYDMFGDPVINEMGWKVEKLNDLYEIIDGDRGKNYPKQEDFSDVGFCLFLNTGNVTKKGFSFDNVQFITDEKDKVLRKGKLERGDVILTTRGTVGNLAYYSDEIKFEHIRINSGMVILRGNADINNIFFIKYFSNPIVYRKLLSGSAQPQLPISNLRNVKIFEPPIELQGKFAHIVNEIESQKLQVQKALDDAQMLYNSLMQEYFE